MYNIEKQIQYLIFVAFNLSIFLSLAHINIQCFDVVNNNIFIDLHTVYNEIFNNLTV